MPPPPPACALCLAASLDLRACITQAVCAGCRNTVNCWVREKDLKIKNVSATSSCQLSRQLAPCQWHCDRVTGIVIFML